MHYLRTVISVTAFFATPVQATQPGAATPYQNQAPANLAQPAIRRDSCVHYEPAVVRLGGSLSIDPEYGPPNYGEDPKTDQQLHVAILHLRHPLTVCGDRLNIDAGEPLKGVLKVQLNFMNLHSNLNRYVGKRIVVKGTLHHAISGHHFTPVVMTVDSVECSGRAHGADNC